MSEILVVTSGKGGVGKTTITISTARSLALEGYRVLVVDGDFGLRDLDLVVGFENHVLFDVTDLWKGRCSVDDAILSLDQNLDFLPASQTNRWEDGGRKKFKRVLTSLKEKYDYILIDAPAGVGKGTLSLLDLADKIIVVVAPLWTSIRDAQRVVAFCNERRLFDCALVVNELYPYAQLPIEEIIGALSLESLGTILPYQPELPKLTNKGMLLDMSLLPDFYQMLSHLVHWIDTGRSQEDIITKEFGELPREDIFFQKEEIKKQRMMQDKLANRLRHKPWRLMRRKI